MAVPENVVQRNALDTEPQVSVLDIPIAPGIARSLNAFRRDLPALLENHNGQWVAYHGDERIGFGRTQTELYQECVRRGLQRDEFFVCSVDTGAADEEEEIEISPDV